MPAERRARSNRDQKRCHQQARGSGWQGAVDAQGIVTMHNANSMRIDGQIDPQGALTAKYSGPACIMTFVWRKQAG